jgi:hypothetical protein
VGLLWVCCGPVVGLLWVCCGQGQGQRQGQGRVRLCRRVTVESGVAVAVVDLTSSLFHSLSLYASALSVSYIPRRV